MIGSTCGAAVRSHDRASAARGMRSRLLLGWTYRIMSWHQAKTTADVWGFELVTSGSCRRRRVKRAESNKRATNRKQIEPKIKDYMLCVLLNSTRMQTGNPRPGGGHPAWGPKPTGPLGVRGVRNPQPWIYFFLFFETEKSGLKNLSFYVKIVNLV